MQRGRFRVQSSEFRVQSSGFRVQGSEFRVQGSEFRVQGSEFRVQGSEFRVQSSGFRVQSSGFRVQGSEFMVLPRPQRRAALPRPHPPVAAHIVRHSCTPATACRDGSQPSAAPRSDKATGNRHQATGNRQQATGIRHQGSDLPVGASIARPLCPARTSRRGRGMRRREARVTTSLRT